jgi:outer membrane autotransporter protein
MRSRPVPLVVCAALAIAPGVAAAADPLLIPLSHVDTKYDDGSVSRRLGISVGINGEQPRLYMFDTGSDQFNAQLGPTDRQVPGAKPDGPEGFYGYGTDGTYGYWLQQIHVGQLTYFDPANPSVQGVTPAGKGGYFLGRVLGWAYVKGSAAAEGKRLSLDPIGYKDDGNGGKIPLYADLDTQERIEQDQPGDEPPFYGTFGAGNFIGDDVKSNALGAQTKSGYIVAANDTETTPGCAPCTILNVNRSLKSQFTTIIPWNIEDHAGYKPTFPGSGGNASVQYEGRYTLTFVVNGVEKTVTFTGPVMLDTGTGDAAFLTNKKAVEDLAAQGLDVPENGNIELKSLKIASADGTGDVVTLDGAVVSRQQDESAGDGLVIGLPFFLQNSVMYDLEDKATGFTPFFVSANNFTTDASRLGQLALSRVTSDMGSLGLAGVISGKGDFTLAPEAEVRLTGVNTYTGATRIGPKAVLHLAGPGSIEQSATVEVNGLLDISQHGNYNPIWGLPDALNNPVIRSLDGGKDGFVYLGSRTLVLSQANGNFAGTITDTSEDNPKSLGGSLTIAGGRQVLSGESAFTGPTTVSPGAALWLTGSLASNVTTAGLYIADGRTDGSVTVKGNGTLAGSGTVGPVVAEDGAWVAPGHPGATGTLRVDGDFAQRGGSTYQAGVGPGTSADRVAVGGMATLDGGTTVEVAREAARYAIGVRHAILTATDGVTGTYFGLTGPLVADSPFIDFVLAYDPNTVFLDVDRSDVAFADIAATTNQRAAARGAESTGVGDDVHDALLYLTRSEARTAFDRLSGEIHASAIGALIEDSHFVRDAANERLRTAFGSSGASAGIQLADASDAGAPDLAAAPTGRVSSWTRAFGGWGHLDGDGNAARLDRNTAGFLVGADTLVADTWRLGFLAGYSHSSFDVDGRASSGSSDNYHLGLYGGTQWGSLGFRTGVAYSWHDLDTRRSVRFGDFSDKLLADYGAGTLQAFGEFGYRFDTEIASLEPFANLAYARVEMDGFEEKGGAAALHARSDTTDEIFTTLGLRVSRSFALGAMDLTARGMAGWRHAYSDVTPDALLAFRGDDAFSIAGAPIARDAAVIEVGIDAGLSDAVAIGLAYSGEVASEAREHGFNAKVRVKF